MINFSSMTVEEFIRLNGDKLSPELIGYIDKLSEQIENLKEDNAILRRDLELTNEQWSFGIALVESLDKFSETLSKPKKSAYDMIRGDTQFET